MNNKVYAGWFRPDRRILSTSSSSYNVTSSSPFFKYDIRTCMCRMCKCKVSCVLSVMYRYCGPILLLTGAIGHTGSPVESCPRDQGRPLHELLQGFKGFNNVQQRRFLAKTFICSVSMQVALAFPGHRAHVKEMIMRLLRSRPHSALRSTERAA